MVPYRSAPITGREIRKTARAAVAVLAAHGIDCCLFGSVACAIYGMENREPNDVDIIVLSTRDREDIKQLFESTDKRLYLVASANPSNAYQVLWFTLSDERACKVDILTPGVISIPHIPVQRIVYQDTFPDIPLAPFLCLLLLKLRGWEDHLRDPRKYMNDKVPIDEDDVEELLELAVEEYGVHLRTEKWMPALFVRRRPRDV